MLNELALVMYLKEHLSDKQSSHVTKEKPSWSFSNYFVTLCLVIAPFILFYGLTAITGVSNAGLERIVYVLTYPLHWEAERVLQADNIGMFKWLGIGAIVSLGIMFIVWFGTQVLETKLLQVPKGVEKIVGLKHSVYLLNLLVTLWAKLLIPILVVKSILFGFLGLVGVLFT